MCCAFRATCWARSLPTGWSKSGSIPNSKEDGTPAWPSDTEANPNGSLRAIAGGRNAAGNVAGLMPHPERASEAVLGCDDGLLLLRSIVDSAAERAVAGGPVAVGAG